MSDTVKLVVEISKPMYEHIQNGTYCGTLYEELKNATPLDDVIAEMQQEPQFYPPCKDCNSKMDQIRRAYETIKQQGSVDSQSLS